MAIEITMPRLSDTMQAGTIVRWAVKEGQKVKSGEAIADVETDKATMELPVYDEGVIAFIASPEGKNVPVGTLIAVVATGGEDIAGVKAKYASGGASAGGSNAAPKAAPAQQQAQGGTSAPANNGNKSSGTAVIDAPAPSGGNGSHGQNGNGQGGRIFVSPLAKKIAGESGLDLSRISGTGPSGRIVRKDVEAAMNAGTATKAAPGRQAAPMVPAPASKLSGQTVSLSNMRRTIARRLVESKTTIPHYQVTVEVSMDALMELRKQLNDQLADQGVKLSVNDFLVRACGIAMHKHPYVNSRWVGPAGGENIELLADVNVGVAISLDEDKGGGLVVATIRAADQIGLRQISAQTKQLAEKARGKGLTLDEMGDSTFTISNLGMFGVDHFTAIINPPNAAILAVGAAIQKPVVKNNQVVPGWVMSMTMSSDHRIIDGAMAAAYLATVKGLLEKPASLLV